MANLLLLVKTANAPRHPPHQTTGRIEAQSQVCELKDMRRARLNSTSTLLSTLSKRTHEYVRSLLGGLAGPYQTRFPLMNSVG